MGAVFLLRRPKDEEQIALKLMLPGTIADAQSQLFFLREIENMKALSHPNIVQLYDAVCQQGSLFFTQEYCNGGSVDRLMSERGGVLSVEEATKIIIDALAGLEYAHQARIPNVRLADGTYSSGNGLVHRDLKPHNIFLCGSGDTLTAKVGDYGFAKAFELAGLTGVTPQGTVAGTPYFMPRQQVINYKYAKPEVDVWACAASLYYMLTGRFPRDFPVRGDPWAVILENGPVPIRDRRSSIPKKLAEVIDSALVESPKIYFQSATELKRALQAIA